MFYENPCDIDIEKLIREDACKNPPVVEVLNPRCLSGYRPGIDEVIKTIVPFPHSSESDNKNLRETIIAIENLIENESFEQAIDIGLAYLKKNYDDKVHDPVIDAMWDNNLSLTDFNDLVNTFPDDFRNYTVRADANLVSFYIIGDDIASDNDQIDEFVLEEKVSPKVAQAIHDYEKAIEMNPDDDYIYGMLAWAYWEKGDIDVAEKIYLDALEVAPENPFGYHAIGYFYDYEGRPNEAILNYKKALELDENSEIVKQSFSNIIDKHYHKMQEKFSKYIPQSVDEIRYSCYQKIVKLYIEADEVKSTENESLYFEKLRSEFPGCKKREKYKRYKKRIESK